MFVHPADPDSAVLVCSVGASEAAFDWGEVSVEEDSSFLGYIRFSELVN